jgi:hypothetical protein
MRCNPIYLIPDIIDFFVTVAGDSFFDGFCFQERHMHGISTVPESNHSAGTSRLE